MMHADNSLFGKWLRDRMFSQWPRVVTPQTLADYIGVSVGAVYGWLSGTSSPPRRRAAQLADMFGQTPEEMGGACGLDEGARTAWVAHQRDATEDARRERYRTDPEYRDRILKAHRTPQEKKSPRQKHIEWVLALPADDRRAFMRHVRAARRHRRRARQTMAGENFTAREFRDKIRLTGGVCCYCAVTRDELLARGQDLSADHLYALSLIENPALAHLASNSIDNIFPACYSCNFSKGATNLMEWAAGKGLTATLHPAAVAHWSAWPAQRINAENRKLPCTGKP